MNQQYRILRATTVSNLKTSVNQATAEGWVLLGGVSVVLVNEIKEIK